MPATFPLPFSTAARILSLTLLLHGIPAVVSAARKADTKATTPATKASATATTASQAESLDPARIEEIASWLPAGPRGVGEPATNRAVWEELAKDPAYAGVRAAAEKLLTRPLPAQPDDLYLEFSRNGNRDHWQKVAFERRGRLTSLVLAECLENRGRFLPAIEQLVAALCAERTWVYPAHDKGTPNFRGKSINIDLGSSALGWNLATADWLLGDKLKPATRALIRENVQRRVVTPYLDMVRGKRPLDHWMKTTNNWNSVCLAGATGASLLYLDSPRERAEAVAGAEHYTKYFLSGFTPDGYCSEGLGYWNYGFGHYVLLAEMLRSATGGKLDLLSVPGVRKPATFGARIQIQDGVSPAFADCSIHAAPSGPLMWVINRRFGLGMEQYSAPTCPPALSTLSEAMVYAFPAREEAAAPASPDSEDAKPGLRTWFDQAGILIGRPAPGSSGAMGVALKGGNNAEHHNHNDLGSYVCVVGGKALVLDPGGEIYTARTFSSRRYESKLLNSFGHSVPVVAGKLQQTGAKAQARVLESSFSDTSDTLRLDLSSAYQSPDLVRLERTFVYDRTASGSLTISDHVEFRKPQSFETALITLSPYRQQVKGARLLIREGKDAVGVQIEAGGKPFEIRPETIRENAVVKPTRLGVRLKEPVTSATVTVRIAPEGE